MYNEWMWLEDYWNPHKNDPARILSHFLIQKLILSVSVSVSITFDLK